MKILFDNITFHKINRVGCSTPSFCAKKSGKDEFVKGQTAQDFDYSDYYASILNDDFSDSEDLSQLPEDVLKRVKEEYVFEGFVDALSQRGVPQGLKMNHPRQPIKDYISMISANQQVSDLLYETFSKANITTAGELGRVMEVYANPKVKKHYEKANIDFFEIFGELNNKSDMISFPDFLLHFKDLAYEKDITDTKQMFEDFCTVFRDLGVKDTDDFCSKFYHLAPDFNDFRQMSDCCDALGYIIQTYDHKIALLTPVAERNKSNNKLNSPQKIYSAIPEVIDTLYELHNGAGFLDLEDYIDLAVSNKNISSKTLSYVKPYFNNFNEPTDDVRFYRLLKNSDISINNLNKIYSKIIVSDFETMPLINNMQNIVSLLAEKDKMNYHLAKDLYVNFADILNVAYSSENSSSDVLSDTFDLIKTCKFKDSSDVLNFYNQANLPNKKSKSITSSEFIDFIDLMKFVNKTDFADPKKVKKIRLDDLKKLREEFNVVKEPIEQFLLNDSNNLFLQETSLSIFNKFRNELVGISTDEMNAKLFELDKFNIRNAEENSRKNLEMERFETFFPSRKALISFVIKNEISFDDSKEEDEYKYNCSRILHSLYQPNKVEESFEQIKKLSNSKFLLKSKNSLNSFFARNFSTVENRRIINTLIDKKVKNYGSFETFVNKYEVDKSSYIKLINFIANMPNEIDFNEIVEKIEQLDSLLENSNYPLELNADNISKLTYDDLCSAKTQDKKLNVNVLNKMLDLPLDKNPVLKLPKVYSKENYATKSKITTEIFGIKDNSEINSKLIEFLYGDEVPSNLSHNKIKKYSYFVPDYFVDFVNSMSKTADGKNYNMSLHSKLRIIERFLMGDIKTDSDFSASETKQKIDNILNSIYNQQQLSIKSSGDGNRILFNSNYDDKTIESVFSKNGMLITAVEKSH